LNQSIYDSLDYLPFGEQIAGGNGTNHKFTGQERDGESGLDDFIARYNNSRLGRFMSPDDPGVDQDPADPQSWNLYTYVRNNPLSNTDPTGNACIAGTNGNVYDDQSPGQSCAEVAADNNKHVPSIVVNAHAPPSLDDLRILQLANELTKRDPLGNAAKIYGISVVTGLTLGTACYYLCPAATTMTLGTVGTTTGAAGAAAPILYRTGEIIEEVVQTPQGPVKIVGEAVVEGTQLTIKNISVFSAETGERLNVGVGNMLKAIRPLFEELKAAGYTTVRIVGDRVSGANPGRAVDITKTLR